MVLRRIGVGGWVSVCIFDPMLRPVLTVCDMNEADKTMRKYWLVAVMLWLFAGEQRPSVSERIPSILLGESVTSYL